MSRRSLISPEENLIRSQRRGVPNVRMWSEQETPPQVAWDGYEEEPAIGGTPPDTVFTGISDSGTQTVGIGAFPTTGMTHAFALLGGMNCNGLTTPPGWTVLAEGGPHGVGDVSGGIVAQWLMLHTTDPAAARSFTFPTKVSLSGSAPFAASAWAYFTGGEGGQWDVIEGAHTVNTTQVPPTGVSAEAWAQLALLTGVYTWGDKNGFNAGQGKMTSACYPSMISGSVPMPSVTPRPPDTLIDWNGIGAYGKPNGLTFAVRWTP